MSYFSVIDIGPDEAEEAYALIRTFAPEVSSGLWKAFMATCAEPGSLLGLLLPGAGLFGIASYRIEDCAQSGRSMLIDNFWTVELSRSAPGRTFLATTLETTAARQGCRAVRQILACGRPGADDDGSLRNHLFLADSDTGTRFSKGPRCTCGNLAAFSAADLFPAQ
jgi:hypothetical protein